LSIWKKIKDIFQSRAVYYIEGAILLAFFVKANYNVAIFNRYLVNVLATILLGCLMMNYRRILRYDRKIREDYYSESYVFKAIWRNLLFWIVTQFVISMIYGFAIQFEEITYARSLYDLAGMWLTTLLVIAVTYEAINGVLKYLFKNKINSRLLMLLSCVIVPNLKNKELITVLVAAFCIGLVRWLFSENSLRYYAWVTESEENRKKYTIQTIEVSQELKNRWAIVDAKLLFLTISISVTYCLKAIIPSYWKQSMLDVARKVIIKVNDLIYGALGMPPNYVKDFSGLDEVVIVFLILLVIGAIYLAINFLVNSGFIVKLLQRNFPSADTMISEHKKILGLETKNKK